MAAEYKILWIDQMTRVAELGGVEHYSRVRFRTKKGIIWTIDIDEPDLTPEKAAPIVEKKAKELDAVMNL